jgi:hypothetical protein
MPPKGYASDVIRIVVGIEGRVTMRSELVIRFDCGCAIPWVSRLENGVLRAPVAKLLFRTAPASPLRTSQRVARPSRRNWISNFS